MFRRDPPPITALAQHDGTIDPATDGRIGTCREVLAPALWRNPLSGKSGFARNVAVMLAGTALGQAASVMLAPVLTRLYSPEQFGYLAVYTAALTFLSVVAALGFELAIPIAASLAELANLLAVSGLALAATTAVVSLAAWLLPDWILNEIWLSPLTTHRYLLPIGFVCLGGYLVMVAAATRVGEFRAIAKTRISQGLSGPMTQILLGVLGVGAPGLAIGFVVGQSSGTYLLFSRVVLCSTGLIAQMSRRGLLAAMRRYAQFPLFASWARLLDMAGSGGILFILISACYSPEVAGYMFLTERVIARPLYMVSTSLLQVFTGEAGVAVRQDPTRIRRRFWQVISRQFLLSSGWIVLANIAAGWAFPLLFGGQWNAAIPYLRAMSVGYLALAVLHPVSTSPQILERQMLATTWQTGRLILVVTSVVTAWRLGAPAVASLWASSLAQASACCVMLGLIANAIRRIQVA